MVEEVREGGGGEGKGGASGCGRRVFCKVRGTTEIYTLSLHDALPIYLHAPSNTAPIVRRNTTPARSTLQARSLTSKSHACTETPAQR